MSGFESMTGAVLTIDPDAVAADYRRLRREVGPAEVAAVVKAGAATISHDILTQLGRRHAGRHQPARTDAPVRSS